MYWYIFNLPSTAPDAIKRLAAANSARIKLSICEVALPIIPKLSFMKYSGMAMLTSRYVAVRAERPYFLNKDH